MAITNPVISQADVELVTGVGRLIQLTDDGASGVVDTTILINWMKFATTRAYGILMVAGWSTAQIDALFAGANAEAPRMATAMICAAMLGSRKPEFAVVNGNTVSYPFSPQGTQGEKILQDLARGIERTPAEETNPNVGRNPRTRSHTIGPRKHIFLRGNRPPGEPGPGGF